MYFVGSISLPTGDRAGDKTGTELRLPSMRSVPDLAMLAAANEPGLEDMEPRHLRYFVAVGGELNISRAPGAGSH